MKNYWHIVAMSAVTSIISIFMQNYLVTAGLFIWLLYLFYFKRITILPFLMSIAAYIFFIYHIPTVDLMSSDPVADLRTERNFTGKIISAVNVTDKKLEFTFQLEATSEKVIIVHFFKQKSEDLTKYSSLKNGAQCTLSGELTIPNEARNPHQFDYRAYLLKRNINYQVVLQSLEEISCENGSLMNNIYALRYKTSNLLTEKFHLETAAWIKALVLGEDSFLDEDIVSLFQRWSLSHILAISGLHIGIVVGLIYFLLIRTGITTKEKAQWIMLAFLPVYALIAGSQPSVWRASLMVMLVIILNKVKLKYNYTDILSIIFLLLIILDKYIIYHIGFQLSFAVTFGLILSGKWLASAGTNTERLLQISFVSQMMILPLQLHYFSSFQPLSILVNLIAVPYFSIFVIPFMFILVICMFFPQFIIGLLEFLFLKVHGIFLDFIKLLDMYVDYPFIVSDFPFIFTVVYYLIFLCMMMNLEKRALNTAFRYGIFLTLFIILLSTRPYFSSVGTVTMLDIGQGDAFVVELPYRKGVFLIDAGAELSFQDFEATDKQYKQVLKPFLHGRGINKIDAIFISHEHLDHFGSVDYLLKEFQVDEIIISDMYLLEEELASKWESFGTRITRVTFDETVIRKNQSFRVVSPQYDKQSANENSLVLYTKLGGYTWLFTGDAYQENEIEMMRSYENLAVDVLKVGHHGSDTSTGKQFIDQINPRYALISVGVNNIYNHPRKEVIDTLTEAGAVIYRADDHGAVQFFFQGEEGYFEPFLEK